MPGDAENVLSMERFKYMTTSVSCTDNSMDITFTDDDTFEHAKAVWDWVNGADNHSFVMVAGSGDCGWNDYRVPFTVFDIEYDEEANHAHLIANASNWQDAVHSFTLDVGHVKAPEGTTKRGETDKDITIDFNHQFPINYTALSVPPLGIALSCSSCGTYGEFVVSVHMETTLGIPRELTVGLEPRGVSMEIDPAITLSVDIGPALAKEFELFAIPLSAIVIPGGVLNIGLSIPFTVGVSMGPLSLWGSISGGVNLAIPDSASLSMNILDPDVQASGWDPIVTTRDVVLDARLTGTLRAYMKAGPALSVNALGGFFLYYCLCVRELTSLRHRSQARCNHRPNDPSSCRSCCIHRRRMRRRPRRPSLRRRSQPFLWHPSEHRPIHFHRWSHQARFRHRNCALAATASDFVLSVRRS